MIITIGGIYANYKPNGKLILFDLTNTVELITFILNAGIKGL